MIADAIWPPARLGEAIEAAAREGGILARGTTAPRAPLGLDAQDDAALERWVRSATDALDIEAEHVTFAYPELAEDLARAAPAVVRVPGGYVVLARRGRAGLRFVTPDGRTRTIDADAVARALTADREAAVAPAVEAVLAAAAVPPARRERAARLLRDGQLARDKVRGVFTLRRPPGTPFLAQVRDAGALRAGAILVLAHAASYALGLASWWLVGRAVLDGSLDAGWLIAWGLLLFSALPLRLAALWQEGRLALSVGRVLKQRLLAGTLRLSPEEIRTEGAGELLGRVIESESVEQLATAGGFAMIVASIELALLASVLGQGAGGALHAVALLAWVVLTGLAAGRMYLRRRALVDWRLQNTRALVERMVGHRTRLAQESPGRWHEGEDELLDGYLGASAATDRAAILAQAVLARGWLVAGLVALAPALLAGEATLGALAVAIGGVLLADRALTRFASGLTALADATVAWRAVGPLFDAAARPRVVGFPAFADAGARAAPGDVVLEARDVTFRHDGRGEPVLRGCSVTLRRGDRVLLEGPSGGGKSTLAALLGGMRVPSSGLVTLHGLDVGTLGADAWRRRVACAPQFHDNHVLTGPFVFNALMGDRWPASEDDMAEAMEVCLQLGLGDLLARMPAGLLQSVGDSGWRLSHGESSRLFLARALLQKADVVVLDESFAALDPENLERCLATAVARAPTLLVIAHP